MSEVPRGWGSAKLKDLVELRTGPFGSSLHRSDYVEGGIPVVNPMHIEGGRIRPSSKHRVSEKTAARLSEFRLSPGDVILGRRGEMGRCAVAQADQAGWLCGTGSLIARPGEAITSCFLQGLLSSDSVVKYLTAESVGTTMVNLNQRILLDLDVMVPPVPEQTRIVEKLEELLSDLDIGVAELKAAQRKLAQYRQSLLKAAVEGTLTADWRATHGVSTESDVKLPTDWAIKSVEQVGDVQLGRQRAPQFHSGDNMVPYLRVANVFENRIEISDVKEMHFSQDEEERFRLRSGDILLNEGQSLELVGRPAIYRDELARACFTNTLVRFRAKPELLPEYALTVFLHYMHSGRFQKIAKITTNIAHLGAGRFAALEFSLPPVAEQAEIIAVLGAQLAIVDEQRVAVMHGLNQAAAQRKNLLKAAFSGQLVPQDPNDEPASALLARIRASRESGTANHATKRGRKAKEKT